MGNGEYQNLFGGITVVDGVRESIDKLEAHLRLMMTICFRGLSNKLNGRLDFVEKVRSQAGRWLS